MEKILFLDRDGVINEDHGYVSEIENFKFKPGIFEFLKKAQEKGYLLIVVTNQGGIHKKWYTEEAVLKLHSWMVSYLKEREIKITEIFYCPHSNLEDCECRKPKPKMLLDALRKYNADPKLSIMVGDKSTDILAGINASIGRLVYVSGNYNLDRDLPCEVVNSLEEIEI